MILAINQRPSEFDRSDPMSISFRETPSTDAVTELELGLRYGTAFTAQRSRLGIED